MRQMRTFFFGVLICVVAALGGANNFAAEPRAQSSQQAPSTLASTVDREISAAEKQIVDVAEAMPEEKFNFSPENLNISGSDYKGFARLPCK